MDRCSECGAPAPRNWEYCLTHTAINRIREKGNRDAETDGGVMTGALDSVCEATMPPKPVPRFLQTEGVRILDNATVRPVGDVAWLDIEEPGMLVRLVMTRKEVGEMIEVLQAVWHQLGGENL